MYELGANYLFTINDLIISCLHILTTFSCIKMGKDWSPKWKN